MRQGLLSVRVLYCPRPHFGHGYGQINLGGDRWVAPSTEPSDWTMKRRPLTSDMDGPARDHPKDVNAKGHDRRRISGAICLS